MPTQDACVTHGEGSWVYTVDGRRLLDMTTGTGSKTLNPKIMDPQTLKPKP